MKSAFREPGDGEEGIHERDLVPGASQDQRHDCGREPHEGNQEGGDRERLEAHAFAHGPPQAVAVALHAREGGHREAPRGDRDEREMGHHLDRDGDDPDRRRT